MILTTFGTLAAIANYIGFPSVPVEPSLDLKKRFRLTEVAARHTRMGVEYYILYTTERYQELTVGLTGTVTLVPAVHEPVMYFKLTPLVPQPLSMFGLW